ncbi:MAG: hypothetical protein K1565_00685 [Candidatus Thiodiazotropha sp. (ex. Lucinisca nassula)]|nr:hypothetical protein [Candidatus Thiodiazotropha sp. (ex. Lucinisca nassula)]
MASRKINHTDQLSLDFNSTHKDSSFLDKSNTSVNVVSFENATNVRIENEKKEMLSLISDYAKKLNW